MKMIRGALPQRGFTLIEVMLVIVLIGLMISVVQFTSSNNQQENMLKRASNQFAGIFELAAEYGMLNNIELGLVIESTSYQFVGFDGTRWLPIAESEVITQFELPEGMLIELALDDLPIEEEALYDRETFEIALEDDDYGRIESEGEDEEVKKIIPHIYLLSGGDITPFSLRFFYDDDVFIDNNISYQVSGNYALPLLIEGPLQ